MDFNKKSKEIFEQNKEAGWWDDMNRCIYQTLQLVNTEIAEATEGARKDLIDDHLPHRKMEEVELADALIRMLDLAGRCGWENENLHSDATLEEVFKPCISTFKNSSAGKVHLILSSIVCTIGDEISDSGKFYDSNSLEILNAYSSFTYSILLYSKCKGYDVLGAMEEKLEYNKNRLDHKRENRAKEGGKKF
jgi:hypothetical protein